MLIKDFEVLRRVVCRQLNTEKTLRLLLRICQILAVAVSKTIR